MKKKWAKIVLLICIAVCIYLFFAYDLKKYVTFDYIQHNKEIFNNYYNNHPVKTVAVFFIVYIGVTTLSLPGATVLTLLGGYLFGLIRGLIIVSFASTLGATLAFLFSRFVLHDFFKEKFREKYDTINKGFKKDGAFYLLSLRLLPVFPFFLINILMGLTCINVWTYYIVSQIGMLAGTAVYINAGTMLNIIQSPSEILNIKLILSFTLLGIFPLIIKALISVIKNRKVYKNYKKPKKFDYNIAVIGAGSAGLVSAYISAAVKAKVILIEKNKMGGDCLNTGCVPSKALIKTAKMIYDIKNSKKFGIKNVDVEINFNDIMDRVQNVIKEVAPHDSVERYTKLGVECAQGEAEIISPFEIKVNDRIIKTKNIVIAAGAGPVVPPIKGLDKIKYLTSDNIWDLKEQPEKLVVLGGGPIGCELAQSFARIGSEVTVIEMAPSILVREDKEVFEFMSKQFSNENINLLTGHRANEVIIENGTKYLICTIENKKVKIEFSHILVAVGRKANSDIKGLDKLGIELNRNGTIKVDDYLKTKYPNIYACGDIAGPYQFTHTASHQAWYCAVNALFGKFKKFKVDYRVIPWCTYTDPEIARVGMNENDAKTKNIEFDVTLFDIGEVDRAIAESENKGFVKVITEKGKDKILGVTIVGYHAGELITEFITAMKYGLGLNKILGTIHIYPTLSEANKSAAGVWKINNVSPRTIKFLERFFKL